MDTQHLVLGALVTDNRSERKVLKHLVDLGEARVRLSDVLFQTLGALISETKVAVDIFVFMVAPQKEDLLGVLKLEGHKEANGLKLVGTTIHIVAQENIIETMDITSSPIRRRLPDVKEAHEISVVTMKATENLYWRLDVSDDSWLNSKDVNALSS